MFVTNGIFRTLALACMLAAATAGSGLAQGTPRPAPKSSAAGPGPAAPPDYVGVWYDDTGEGAVEIAPCGDSLCGRIVWLKNPNDPTGRPLTDGYNPNPANRTRPICGLDVIGGVKRQGNGTWDQGWIYDPKEGKSYDVELKLRGPDRLAVTGYLGVKFLSETLMWTRATSDLRRCAG